MQVSTRPMDKPCKFLHTTLMPRSLLHSPRQRYRLAALLGCLLSAIALTSWQAARWAQQTTVTEIHGETLADASLRAALIGGEIDRFRMLPKALVADRDIVAALSHLPGAIPHLDQRLDAIAAESGAAALFLLDAQGMTIAASNYKAANSFVGKDYSFRNYYRNARRDGEGLQFGMGTASHHPGLYVALRTVSGGYIVVKREFLRIEEAWTQGDGMTLVTDATGIVLVASPQALRFRALDPLGADRRTQFRNELQSGSASLEPLGFVRNGDLVHWKGRDWVEGSAPVGAYGWRVHRLVPVDRRIARAVSMAAALSALAGLLLAFVAGSLWWGRYRQRRRTIELEQEVTARTADLRREMAERTASEEHAALLREELRQANRLATLGQVSAGIAHETAQPIAAIRAYAENGLAFLERAEPQAAQDNFTAIRRLTDRLSTITAQLRGFARRAEDEQQAMSLASAVEGALLILRPRLKGIACLAEPGDVPAVRASRVKLEQVLVNLLQNAADALAETPSPTIHLSCAVKEDHLVLTITDNGPGIAPEIAQRLFTPFATSRKSGLGLGLVIARDIMREMGGDLQWRRQPGGAVFDVTLVRA